VDKTRLLFFITALTCMFAVPQMCSEKSLVKTWFTLPTSEIRTLVCRHIARPLVRTGDIHRSCTGVEGPVSLAAVKPLQAAAMGLVIVLLGPTVHAYDLLPDPVGWILVLIGLTALPGAPAGHAAGAGHAQPGRLGDRVVPRRP
jgi:hypothetical protein